MAVIINVDIDTTGLFSSRNHQICRIVAFNNEDGYTEDAFSLFLMPTCKFDEMGSKLNKFIIEGNNLLFNGELVKSPAEQRKGLQDFYDYITESGQRGCYLMSYYAEGFLAPIITEAFGKHLGYTPEDMEANGIKFIDPYKMMIKKRDVWFPGIRNLKLPTVHEFLFPNEKTYKTPNAKNDAIALYEVLAERKVKQRKMIAKYSFSATEVEI